MLPSHSPALWRCGAQQPPRAAPAARIHPVPSTGAVSCSASLAATPGWGSSSFTQVSASFCLSELVELCLDPAQARP